MAKKTENKLSYLQMPLPESGKYSKMTKVAFGGLNNRYTIDSGELSKEINISTNEYPYITPSNRKREILSGYEKPISMFAFDDFIVVIYRDDHSIKVDYITEDYEVCTGIIKSDGATSKDEYPRSVVQFNVYDTPTDPLTGRFVKKLLIFPDKVSMDFRFEVLDNLPDNPETGVVYCTEQSDGTKIYTVYSDDGGYEQSIHFPISYMSVLVKEFTPTEDKETPPDTASHNYYYRNSETSDVYRWIDDTSDSENSGWKVSIPPAMPDIKYATVHLSRVFGVDDDRVYASGYNDYTNWNLDAVGEYNEANSWCSPSQSNTKADGNFTGITTFQNHVICFKRDFMHEIYNTKNPFRIQDIYAEGAIDNRTIQDVDGKLIFVSEDDVKIYTGSNPRIIGYNLNMSQYSYAVSGTDNRHYYLYCEDKSRNKHLYVYDTFTELWSEQEIDDRVINFAHNQNGMYMLTKGGCIYKMDSNRYNHKWSFETDVITNKTVDIKHIKKLQMLVDIPEYVNNLFNVADDSGNDAYMKVYILYDDEVFDENKSHLVYESCKFGRLPIRVKPRKTANYGFKLHFEGAGYVKLYELEIFVESGGDLYV